MIKNASITIAIILGVFLVGLSSAWPVDNNPTYGYNRKHYITDGDEADPEMMYAILSKLGQTIIKANEAENNGEFFSSKRGLDLGLSRGYSGSQQAKHMMGIAAAGLSGGPGRKRRDDQFNMFHYRLPQFVLPVE